MFSSSRLAYLELHKTGSQQIRRLLKEHCEDGLQQGNHNRLPKQFNNRYIIGSIRNPWDWYVSLWSYGCGRSGGLRQQLIQRKPPLKGYSKWIFFNPYQAWLGFCAAQNKPTEFWKSLYYDVNDPQLFRTWIAAVLDVERSFDLGERYGFSPIKQTAGFLTFRYFKLYCRDQVKLFSTSFNTVEDIIAFDFKNSLLNFTIRNENLEQNFIEAMTSAGYQLSSQQTKSIYANVKTNVSKRHGISYYYDKKTIDLVLRRERFIVDKFKYEPPTI